MWQPDVSPAGAQPARPADGEASRDSRRRVGSGSASRRGLGECLGRLAPASAELLARRELLRRTDTKFLLPADLLAPLVDRLAASYRVLDAGTGGLTAYRTTYFDTPSLRCFHDHRRGRRVRQKVRVRDYLDRSLSFVEVKCRQTDLLTLKHRRERAFEAGGLEPRERTFASEHCRVPTDELAPVARVAYRRAILVGAEAPERVTIDVDLQVGSLGAHENLEGIAIVEIKQPAFSAATCAMRALRDLRVRSMPISKYCTAIALTRAGVRCNRFLPALRAIERMRI